MCWEKQSSSCPCFVAVCISSRQQYEDCVSTPSQEHPLFLSSVRSTRIPEHASWPCYIIFATSENEFDSANIDSCA